jgi:hypothetical protein
MSGLGGGRVSRRALAHEGLEETSRVNHSGPFAVLAGESVKVYSVHAMAEDRELTALTKALTALKPLDAEEQQRALNWLASKLGVEPPSPLGGVDSDEDAAGGDEKLGTIKAFLKAKSPKDDVQRITTLAYYEVHANSKEVVTFKVLTAARVAAALPTFNVSRAISNAQRPGYLTTGSASRTYVITATGEAVVDALPNQEEVKSVTSQSRRRKSAAKRKKPTRKSPTARSS